MRSVNASASLVLGPFLTTSIEGKGLIMFKYISTIAIAIVLSTSFHLDAGAQTSSGYQSRQIQNQVQVERGTVIQVREIKVEGSEMGMGIGGLLGGLLGAVAAQNTDNYAAKAAAAAIGGTLGGLAGKKFSGNTGAELIIQKENGSIVAVTQESGDNTLFGVGQRVLFIGGRVLPDTTQVAARY